MGRHTVMHQLLGRMTIMDTTSLEPSLWLPRKAVTVRRCHSGCKSIAYVIALFAIVTALISKTIFCLAYTVCYACTAAHFLLMPCLCIRHSVLTAFPGVSRLSQLNIENLAELCEGQRSSEAQMVCHAQYIYCSNHIFVFGVLKIPQCINPAFNLLKRSLFNKRNL